MIQKTLHRIFYYWTGYWSFSAQELREQPYEPFNVFYVSCMTLMMLRGIRRLWSTDRAAVLPYMALVGVFPLTYYVTHSLMDYSQPIAPAIVVMAVAGALPFIGWQTSSSPESQGNQPIGAELAREPAF